MADRYPDRPFPADDYDRGGDQHGSDGAKRSARRTRPADRPDRSVRQRRAVPILRRRRRTARAHAAIPAAAISRAGRRATSCRLRVRRTWIQRANIQRRRRCRQRRQPTRAYRRARARYQARIIRLRNIRARCIRCIVTRRRPAPQSEALSGGLSQASYDQAEEHADPSRYDDALYGQLEVRRAGFPARPRLSRRSLRLSGWLRGGAGRAGRKRRGGLLTVAAVLALAVVGTGAAFAYRTYVGSPRSGEPPIIKADNSPTKIVPAPGDGSGKTPDRMPTGDGAEKIVPREETPVDVNARAAGPRVVFPPLNAEHQSAVAGERVAQRHAADRRRRRRRRPTARCRTASRARSGPSRFTAIRPMTPPRR